MTESEIGKFVAGHARWLGGHGGCRADFAGANLQHANFTRVNLRHANFAEADLCWAHLGGSNLDGSCLINARLVRADLNRSDLRRADLSGADLSRANLVRADLRGASLVGAKLGEAFLSWADLAGADLSGAHLVGADLQYSHLGGSRLQGVVGMPPLAAARLEILPRRGDVFGWKRCQDDVFVELVVPDGVERSNATGRKCRARLVRVVSVHGGEVGMSIRDDKTAYRAGEIVECDRWEPDRWVECGGGIHFYLTREEAEARGD